MIQDVPGQTLSVLASTSVRIAAERAAELRREPGKLACEAWTKRAWSPSRVRHSRRRTLYQLSSHARFGQLALQHHDRGQEIVASGSPISGKDRVGGVGDIGDTRPLLLVVDVGIEKLNLPTQIIDERLQFHSDAGRVQ